MSVTILKDIVINQIVRFTKSTMKNNILNLTATIAMNENNEIIDYDDKKWVEKIVKFKSKNLNKQILITFEVVDTPMHYLFKYYYGQLLPSICDALGDVNRTYVDKMILKKEHLFYNIDNDFSKIKSTHKSGNQFFSEKRVHEDETGNQIEYDYVTGYTPSKACITHERMKEFIIECENFLFNFHERSILEKYQDQAKINRMKGFDQRSIDSMGEEVKENFDDIRGFND